MISNITWLGHASFKIADRVTGKVIYCDPWKLKHTDAPEDKADLILVSHPHFDHFSPEDINKILKPETIIVSVKEVVDKFPKNSKLLTPSNRLTVFGIEIEAIPAYNPAKQFHPRNNNWNGYVFNANNLRIYHAGDTDATPEMLALKEISYDQACGREGGTYTMDALDAANTVNTFKPKLALPMHYGDIVGKWEDGITFKNNCKIDVVLLKPE